MKVNNDAERLPMVSPITPHSSVDEVEQSDEAWSERQLMIQSILENARIVQGESRDLVRRSQETRSRARHLRLRTAP